MEILTGITGDDIFLGVDRLSLAEAQEAIQQLSKQGITTDATLPFLRVTYNQAADELCEKLGALGCPFIPHVTGTYSLHEGCVYVIYDPGIFDNKTAIEWLRGRR